MEVVDIAPDPLPIRRLEESLVNRIAAGEIIHRPASALKELIENCLDARSTSIKITVKDGGLKLLQIQDNGVGIRKSDLPILAQRFTTSKLSTFSDLSKLRTYGFRGEALASISHVAHLQVITKTKTDGCAWKVLYEDGSLTPSNKGQAPDPKPTAGTNGTTITVEDLFYNTPTRLAALRSSSEEYTRILDVVTKYAVHNPLVAFVCKKAGQASADISTPGGKGTTAKHVIKLLYGANVARELVELRLPNDRDKERGDRNVNEGDMEGEEAEEDQFAKYTSSWKGEALMSSANYQSKKTTFLLFINHRLVDAPRIKKACETVYSSILPKGAFPFLYLSLEIEPQNIDVNVHPTKREVHFLHEEEIIDKIAERISEGLSSGSTSRVFQYQTLLTGGIASENSKYRDSDPSQTASSSTPAPKKVYSHHKIRQSQDDRTLESMYPVAHPATRLEHEDTIDLDAGEETMEVSPRPRIRDIAESECFLTSVSRLRSEIEESKHKRLTEIIAKHVFVGIVDLDKCLSLIQHSTKLYLVNHAALSEEFFYQIALRQFGNFRMLKLEPPPDIRELIELAVGVEDGIKEAGLKPKAVVDRIVKLIMARKDMLEEYFALKISKNGQLISLPLLLRDFTPNLDKLPLFLMRLGPQVNWNSEKECFASFMRELAFFYLPAPLVPGSPSPLSSEGAGNDQEKSAENKAERWQIQHVLFPAMRKYLVATKQLLDKDVVQIANLPDLYKVFERC